MSWIIAVADSAKRICNLGVTPGPPHENSGLTEAGAWKLMSPGLLLGKVGTFKRGYFGNHSESTPIELSFSWGSAGSEQFLQLRGFFQGAGEFTNTNGIGHIIRGAGLLRGGEVTWTMLLA